MVKNNKIKDVTYNKLAEMIAKGFSGNDKRFDSVDKRLDRIEFILTAQHNKRIEKLEEDVRGLKDLLHFK